MFCIGLWESLFASLIVSFMDAVWVGADSVVAVSPMATGCSWGPSRASVRWQPGALGASLSAILPTGVRVNGEATGKTMAALPWAAAEPFNLDGYLAKFEPEWLARPEIKPLVETARKLEEVERSLNAARIADRMWAVEEVLVMLRAIDNVPRILAMDERRQLEVLCRIADAVGIRAELRDGVFADAIEIARRMQWHM